MCGRHVFDNNIPRALKSALQKHAAFANGENLKKIYFLFKLKELKNMKSLDFPN